MKLAKEYPQALTYTFQLSFEEFQKQSKHVFLRHEVQLILDRIKKPLIDRFIKAVHYLSFPGMVIKFHLNKILRKNHAKTLTLKTFHEELNVCYKEIFDNRMRGHLPIQILNQKAKLEALKSSNECEFIFYISFDAEHKAQSMTNQMWDN